MRGAWRSCLRHTPLLHSIRFQRQTVIVFQVEHDLLFMIPSSRFLLAYRGLNRRPDYPPSPQGLADNTRPRNPEFALSVSSGE